MPRMAPARMEEPPSAMLLESPEGADVEGVTSGAEEKVRRGQECC